MRIIISVLIVLVLQSCALNKKGNNTDESQSNNITIDYTSGPPIIIYKTKKNYRQNVAVGLSDDKTKIISYPHPSDVYYKGELAYPTKLNKGYLLDNQGINMNVAFLSISLEQYSSYENAPSLEELYSLIIDKNPLKELYYCGNRQKLKDEIIEINKIISEGQLKECKCLSKN